MSARIRVLIADDHQMFIDGIQSLLKDVADIIVVAEALNGLKALSQLAATHIDVALLDINMPELNGLETCRDIVSRYPEVKVLMLTMHNRANYIRQFIDLGAKGYILKNTGKAELLQAIRTVHQ
ncbi:MAG: response regulator transcription factor, partial [Bacteroidota bacterium]